MPTAPLEQEPISLTVAICTHNRAAQLADTLRSLEALEAPGRQWELLVVDNASTDGTPALLEELHWRPGVPLRCVREERLGVSYARNRAVEEARGEYVLFIDDDETPHEDWLAAHARALREHAPDATGGRIEVRFIGAERPSWLTDELLGFLGRLDHGPLPRRLTDEGQKIFTGNAAFRRETVRRLGLFDTSLGRRGRINAGGEDVDLFVRLLRAGCDVRWVPDAIIFHRIEAEKLRRGYFLDLHYRQGRMEAIRRRGAGSRVPPKYFYGQLLRAIRAAWDKRRQKGPDSALRLEMNAAYFFGVIVGWALAKRPDRL
jgi:glycosyltransferase involved in cell wall biosynthesis